MDRSELANLTAFVAVADRRSFRAAASQLGVTPSRLATQCGNWNSVLDCASYTARRVAYR